MTKFFHVLAVKVEVSSNLSYEHWLKCRNVDASKKIFVATSLSKKNVALCGVS